ncbi:RNA polymerase sigma factor [Sunxiuqinia elliptica]|uniref:RNA polymerase sigma-70 factor, ECF subfamily n=1 Tax=Sunxiuqinia elliptica TaxID=655355 RepID=A0A1I2G4Y1_9BACT|nr:RNA polymerase sigma-70 factor [Sunxiuqinia elliptica]SFF12050.1 RNA polymerase sigma-70 factor, ECF subfamily [Sunxiuqinia elliptica]
MTNRQPNNELELIQKLKAGDSAAFETLFGLYAGKLFYFVNKYLDLKEEAEEIVQDVFLNLWKHKKEIRSEKAFKSYLYQIALNNIRNYFNKKLVQEKHKQLIAQNYLFEKEADADELDYESVIKKVDQLINQLPPKRKEIFLLSRKEGLDISEIANYLNISEATVKNQITSAVAFLKKAAKETGLSNTLFLVLFYY